MSSKAIAVHTIFLIGAMLLLVVFTVAGLWFWLGDLNITSSEAACANKYQDYCDKWIITGKEPGNWDSVSPEGCDEYEIYKPKSIDECKLI